MSSHTNAFDKDNQKIRQAIKKHKSLIQYENNSGLRGNRYLNLAIGVPPIYFDTMITELKTIGRLKSIVIDKVDKTNEFKELQAKRITLDKSLVALTKLKERSGEINDFVELEQKILDLEGQIQALGVTLGDFDEENEFCTVKITLSEKKTNIRNIHFMGRLKKAIEWTVKYYGLLAVGLFFTTIGLTLLIKILEKLGVITSKAK